MATSRAINFVREPKACKILRRRIREWNEDANDLLEDALRENKRGGYSSNKAEEAVEVIHGRDELETLLEKFKDGGICRR